MVGTLVLNNDYEVLGSVSWQRAVKMMAMGKALIHEADPERTIRGATAEFPFPRAVRLVKWIYVKYTGRHADGAGLCTKKGILERDSYTCVYCGGKANTIDHVFPASRGGRSSWENQAAACEPCNAFKADRTPDEARMRLRWHPYRPDKLGMEQRKVWASLEKLEHAEVW